MTARYRPKGLLGIAYWYAVVPLHNIVFGGMLRGIRDTAQAISLGEEPLSRPEAKSHPTDSGYGRARLWLGISAVGTLVLFSSLGLLLGVGDRVNSIVDSSFSASAAVLALFVLAYSLVQLPFDVFGGYLLPKRYSRDHLPWGAFLGRLLRGVFVHGLVLYSCALLLTLASAAFGMIGAVAAGLVAALGLLAARVGLAALVSPLTVTPSDPKSIRERDALGVAVGESEDEGFTGGVIGGLRPRCHLLPLAWRRVLGSDGFELALRRRSLAVTTGGWLRGRIVSIAFTLIGVAAVALLVGPSRLGAAGGTITMSFWFTLWSFLGLLMLPTLSRRAVLDIDQRLREQASSFAEVDVAMRRLDELQDDEPVRPTIVETIFHPIPSVESRLRGPRQHGAPGAWDAARTAVYLSASGIGLLGRAVHCNCGRPALWVFLPTD